MPVTPVPLIDRARLAAGVAELGGRINADYAGRQPLLVVGVLKGSFLFLADLVRRLDVDVNVDFLRVASYGDATQSSGEVEIRKDLETPLSGRHVLIVEDIVDTGLTLNFLLDRFSTRKPASLATCTLLSKPSRREVQVPVEYVGFEIGDDFVVGYGLDYAERYRQLPEICVLDPPPTGVHGSEGAGDAAASADA